jgi:hypothetical protein
VTGFTFANDETRTYLRSRFGLSFDNLLTEIDAATCGRRVPFKLEARPVAGSGNLIEVILIAAQTEPGDERVLGSLIRAFQEVCGSNVVIVPTIRYRD